jgi:hypothetical protein
VGRGLREGAKEKEAKNDIKDLFSEETINPVILLA